MDTKRLLARFALGTISCIIMAIPTFALAVQPVEVASLLGTFVALYIIMSFIEKHWLLQAAIGVALALGVTGIVWFISPANTYFGQYVLFSSFAAVVAEFFTERIIDSLGHHGKTKIVIDEDGAEIEVESIAIDEVSAMDLDKMSLWLSQVNPEYYNSVLEMAEKLDTLEKGHVAPVASANGTSPKADSTAILLAIGETLKSVKRTDGASFDASFLAWMMEKMNNLYVNPKSSPPNAFKAMLEAGETAHSGLDSSKKGVKKESAFAVLASELPEASH